MIGSCIVPWDTPYELDFASDLILSILTECILSCNTLRTTCCIYVVEQVYLVTNLDLHYQRLWKDREEQVMRFYFINRFVDLLCNIYQCLFCGAVIAVGTLTFI